MNKEVLSKSIQGHFSDVLSLIEKARTRALQKVNSELVELYWEVGKYIHNRIESAEWGDSVVTKLAEFLKTSRPDIKGFERASLFRMKQFYETWADNEKVATLWRQINWSNHRIILARKTPEEREFYLRVCVTEQYSTRELRRQVDSGYFERVMTSDLKYSPVLKETYPEIEQAFRDSYNLEFLGLPSTHSEKDLRQGIVSHLKDFILEFGRDFTFMGEEYKVAVGDKKFSIDLLFFHRGLKCLVAFELKVAEFKPSHMGQMSFYLQALDEYVKRDDENPSVGIILCKSKDDEVVRLALRGTVSPTLVSDYETQLHLKTLEAKFHEISELADQRQEDKE